jgi:hypothetical protein
MYRYIKNGISLEDDYSIDRNSTQFDKMLLEELKKLKNIPVNKFMSEVRKIMRKKSSAKLWFDNKSVEEWNPFEQKKEKCNFRCCPSSRSAGFYFCLQLNRTDEKIDVIDGFLSPV